MIQEYLQEFLPFLKKSNKESPIPQADIANYDRITYILSEFNSNVSYINEHLDRASESWNLYKGYGGSSYPFELREKFKKEGRNPFEGNIIRQKVDGLAGSIIKNFFDINFEPVDGELSDLTQNLKELLLIDKELTNWNTSYSQLVVDGLIHLGVEEMYIDFKFSPYGNIGFRPIAPNHIILDSNWLSNNAYDLKRAFKVAYLTPMEIKEIYKTKSEEIDNFVKMKSGKATTFDHGDKLQGVLHSGLNENYGDQYRVIEYHHMEREKKTIEIITATGDVVPEGTDQFKQEWAILNNIDLSEGVMSKSFDVDVYYTTSICPSLSKTLILEDKQGLIQIGRLPFFPWSCGRINGINSGIPDLLKSIQQTYNFRESLLDYSISTSAAGFTFIDPDIVGGDAGKMREVEDNWNKPKARMWSEPGAVASGREFFKQLPTNKMDYSVVQEITRMIDMADRISKQPAAMDARSEGSEETGILYARKQLQAEVTLTLLTKSLEQHWNDKGEAYFLTAKRLYSGIYRKFHSMGNKKTIELNIPVITPSGTKIENDISMLPRMKVIVSLSPEGVTTRSIDRSINTELLRVIGVENPISRAQAVKNVMSTLDNSKTERKQFEEASELEFQLAKETVITNILNLKSQQMQIQMQLQQAMQPQLPGIDQVNPQNNQQQEPPRSPGNPQSNMQGANVAVEQQMAA